MLGPAFLIFRSLEVEGVWRVRVLGRFAPREVGVLSVLCYETEPFIQLPSLAILFNVFATLKSK